MTTNKEKIILNPKLLDKELNVPLNKMIEEELMRSEEKTEMIIKNAKKFIEKRKKL